MRQIEEGTHFSLVIPEEMMIYYVYQGCKQLIFVAHFDFTRIYYDPQVLQIYEKCQKYIKWNLSLEKGKAILSFKFNFLSTFSHIVSVQEKALIILSNLIN